MTERNCMEMLRAKFREGKHVCVGLDTDPPKISKEIGVLIRKEDNLPPCGATGPVMRGFNTRIVEATRDLVCAYKFNLKFYLAEMYQGLFALERSVAFIKEAAPDVITILDSKDGDVGVSLTKAAEFGFDKLGVDAVTVNPWGGKADGLDAFLKYENKGIFVWCQSSNEGARDFQFRERSSKIVAIKVATDWNAFGNCGLVVGATYPKGIAEIRRWAGSVPFLVPGIGAQEGDLGGAIKAAAYSNPATSEKSFPAIINSSRGIIYASSGTDFAKAARKEVMRLNRQIRKILKEEGLR